ncbi:hypothetical protein TA3x_001296 [Tundrisphaera sp. TA3]|uniref:hypothetical protein n=1 Tax=Tundrisphaera sp. TA3 TaxID=3435775 RepID=UPI003EB83DA5
MMSISTPMIRRGMGAALLFGGLASASAWGQDRPAADPSNPPAIDLVAPTGMQPAPAATGPTTLAPLDDVKPAEAAAPSTDLAAATTETGIPDYNAPVEPDTRPVKPAAEGPLHEAFLSPVRDREPEHVPKAPPAPLEERPGVEPTDPGAVWIPGYWVWDAGKKDFVWATGTYRIPPPGRFWVNGYWKRDEQGWSRVPGFWSDRQTDRIDWRKDGPPTTHPPDEVGKSPGEDYFYIPGHYAPDGDGVVWKKGYWAKSQPDWAWVPAQWVRQPEGWAFQEGYWDRTLEDRGTLFAPALVSEEARQQGVTYQPVTQVTPETFGQLYGAFGRPNSYYDGYPGCYFDESGNYYGYANYGNLGTYYGYLDYPYNTYAGANYISTAVGGYGLGYYPGYYGGSGLGFGRFGGGLLGGLFTNLAYGFGSSYYGGFGTGYYPGYLGGLGFGGLGYLGGLGYGLGFFPGYGGYGGFGGYNRFGYGGRNWYGRNDNHHRPPFYPGHQPGRGPGQGNWNGGGGPGNWNGGGRPGGVRPGFPNQNLVNNAVRNATINTGVVNRNPKQPVARNSFVNHVGNPSDLSRMLRNPASLPPAASRPYGNAFRGPNTAANTPNRGIAPNTSNWTPGYNGVRRNTVNHTTARPAFSSGSNSGPIGRPNGTLSGPMQNSINSFQRGGNPANLGNRSTPGGLNTLRPGNSPNLGRPGPGGGPSQNNFARSGVGSNPLQGFTGGNLNRPQGTMGGINRTPGLSGNNLNGLQGLNRSPNVGIGGNPNLGGGRGNPSPLGGARPNLGAGAPRPNLGAGAPRPNIGAARPNPGAGVGGLGGGALAAPRPTNSFSPRLNPNFAGAGSLNRPGGASMGGMSRPGGGFAGGPAMGGMGRPGGGFGGAPAMGGINRGGGMASPGGGFGGRPGGGFSGGGPRMGGSPGGFSGGGPRMGGGGGGGGRPGGGGGGGGGRR